MSDWKNTPLGDLLATKPEYGANASAIEYDGIGPRYLRITDIDNDGSLIGTEKAGIEYYQAQQYLLSEGDIVIARTGNTVGKSYLHKKNNGILAYAGYLIKFQVNTKLLLPEFLFQHLHSPAYYKWINTTLRTGAQPNINAQEYCSIELHHPVFTNVQRKIARILTNVDNIIEKTEAAIEKYKAIKQGMMHDLFTRGIDVKTSKLRPKFEDAPELYKESDLGWIPKEWEVKRIGESNVNIIDGDRGSNYPHESELLENGYCLFLSAVNVTINGFRFLNKQFISKEKESQLGSGKLELLDIIITTRGTVGNIAFFDNSIPFEHLRINSGMLILRNRELGISPDFLFYAFKNYLFNIDYRKVVSGSAQPQLPMKDLKGFRLIKPAETEQQTLVLSCKHYDNLLLQEEKFLNKYKKLKAGLMQDLLTGKKEVTPDTEDYKDSEK